MVFMTMAAYLITCFLFAKIRTVSFRKTLVVLKQQVLCIERRRLADCMAFRPGR
jgi:hypothetical protein